MKRLNYSLMILAAVMLLSFPVIVFAAGIGEGQADIGASAKAGWVEIDGKYYYQKKDGSILEVTGLYQLGDYYYLFDEDHSRCSGFQTVDGKLFYFVPSNGRRYGATGWRSVRGNTYYFKKDHSIITGVSKIAGVRYFLDENGAVQANRTALEYDGAWYDTDENGVMTKIRAGWVEKDGGFFYRKKDGSWLQGPGMQKIGNYYYCLAEDGSRTSGFVTVDGAIYYFNTNTGRRSGTTGWDRLQKKTVWFKEDHSLATGVTEIEGTLYLFGEDGALCRQAAPFEYDGRQYRTDRHGILKAVVYKEKWIEKDGKYFYRLKDGSFMEGPGQVLIGDYYYFLNKDGSRARGFHEVDGKLYYYILKKGRRYTAQGWKDLSKKTYYFTEDHSLAAGLTEIDGKNYLFSSLGILQRSRKPFEMDGGYYRTNADGVAEILSATQVRASELTRAFIDRHSSADQSNYSRFRSCYYWLLSYMYYRPKSFSEKDFQGTDWPYTYVVNTLGGDKIAGNCYGFCCTIASIAKELGYEPNVIIMTLDHGVVEIDGKYYDNMGGGLFGADAPYHRNYQIYKKVKF